MAAQLCRSSLPQTAARATDSRCEQSQTDDAKNKQRPSSRAASRGLAPRAEASRPEQWLMVVAVIFPDTDQCGSGGRNRRRSTESKMDLGASGSTEKFMPLAMLKSIRILMAISAYFNYEIWQMDVNMEQKTAFLNGKLTEDIYMEQPEGFVHPKNPNKVYDILLIGNDVPTLQSVKSWLSKCFQMKDLGEAAYILGIKIYRNRSKRLIGLSQMLSKTQCPVSSQDQDKMKSVPYASAIGSIMYAMLCTRPDVAYSVSVTSRYQQNPGEPHWVAVKNILKYLRRTKDMFLVFGGSKDEISVNGYSDASFQTDIDDFRSQSGYVFTLNGGAISWKSLKQDTIADSTTEADVAQAKEPREHHKSRHVLRKYHLIREIIGRGDVRICKIPTEDNVADPLTKPLARVKHEAHANSIGMQYLDTRLDPRLGIGFYPLRLFVPPVPNRKSILSLYKDDKDLHTSDLTLKPFLSITTATIHTAATASSSPTKKNSRYFPAYFLHSPKNHHHLRLPECHQKTSPVYFYLSFSSSPPCILHLPNPPHNTQILLKIKTDLGRAKVFTNWNTNNPVCNFTGIVCSGENYVKEIDLSHQKLAGALDFDSICSSSLGSSLEKLSMGSNLLHGTITSHISNCTNLNYLDLSDKHFSGEFPEISSLTKLHFLKLNLSGFSGQFPWKSLQYLTNLTNLSLGDNPFELTPFPLEILNLEKLQNLFLSNSSIQGTIPEAIGNLLSLQTLELSHNYLVGEIPDTITKLNNLQGLELYNNELNGSFPVGMDLMRQSRKGNIVVVQAKMLYCGLTNPIAQLKMETWLNLIERLT
ncbi:hypothetical protein OSB04_002513 [Centaurea solstitialis]|uniref:Leucine-rich repeat-containing N-terminal plant-type domain-containing protein n=1 Tax=Centaurea solstitialis TaxID=347529 RepID=A0AA38UAT2_9ASTR|nr:hypothetical protein OSB04_002513 [Centaurea solstitialis]